VIYLRHYSHRSGRPNTWDFDDSDSKLLVVIQLADTSPRIAFTVPVYWRKPRAGARFIAPLDSDCSVWRVESKQHHPNLPRDGLELLHAPPTVADKLRDL
jgi:hypothetical protein